MAAGRNGIQPKEISSAANKTYSFRQRQIKPILSENILPIPARCLDLTYPVIKQPSNSNF